MKIAVLWMGLSGYLNACLKELGGREKVELFVCHKAPESNAPFDENQFGWITNRFVWNSDRDLENLAPKLRAFAPDILLFSGWHVPAYRRAARLLANKCWRVMAMDRCWLATLKQRIGAWTAPYFLHPLADAVWLPGERQAAFARKLGFRQHVIIRGLYACDQPVVEVAHTTRIATGRPVPRSFLFIGRFVPEKCIDTLANAYVLYREGSPEPWPLVCCGTGPLRSRLEDRVGIKVEGFVQPDRLPMLLASAGCLILPSRFEPWAVVVHEAASSGLVILASEEVGAVPHLVQPGYNGFIFDDGDVASLASLMSRVAAMSDARLDNMSRASFALSRQFSPRRWADTLLELFATLSTRGCSPDDMPRNSHLQDIRVTPPFA
jgi:glycosyltransferase involved in cell wall biosynthesis